MKIVYILLEWNFHYLIPIFIGKNHEKSINVLLFKLK